MLHWENRLSPFQVPREPGKKLRVRCASKEAGGGFGTECQGEREKLAGDLPSTGEGIRGQDTWGLEWGTESLASPDLHIVEPAGTTAALNGGNGGCYALNCTAPAQRWGKTGLIVPPALLTSWFPPRQDLSATQKVLLLQNQLHTQAQTWPLGLSELSMELKTPANFPLKQKDKFITLSLPKHPLHGFLQELHLGRWAGNGVQRGQVTFLSGMYPH